MNVFRSKIAESLALEFQGTWNMLRQAIKNVPNDHWTKGTNDWYYSLTVFHVIQNHDFYSRPSPEGFEWGGRLGLTNWWDTMSREEFTEKITKDDMLKYLEEMEKRVMGLLTSFSNKGLTTASGFSWVPTNIRKFQYLLRHNTYHIGQLALKLREWGCKRLEWK